MSTWLITWVYYFLSSSYTSLIFHLLFFFFNSFFNIYIANSFWIRISLNLYVDANSKISITGLIEICSLWSFCQCRLLHGLLCLARCLPWEQRTTMSKCWFWMRVCQLVGLGSRWTMSFIFLGIPFFFFLFTAISAVHSLR